MGPEAFDYTLPADRIAQVPAGRRSAARMLVLGREAAHATVADLPQRLPVGALVVVNDSKVVPARLRASSEDGRTFELLLCGPRPGQGPGTSVRAWVRGGRRLRPGDVVRRGSLRLRLEGPDAVDRRARRFQVVDGEVLPALEATGEVPLPPYIERAAGPDPIDRERYQTVFAAAPGSVAAPTAGLHLDHDLLAVLDPVRITVHVGPGTFLPMEVADVQDHRVGPEQFEIPPAAATRIELARREGRPIVAIGTTTTRALESVAAAHQGAVAPGAFATHLVITPGFRFRVVSGLLTNFHLPRSSLLMLVCSLGGRTRVLEAYRAAVDGGYRFYSYGDSMLVSPLGGW